MATVTKRKWWKIQWFSDEDTHEERKFLMKLDIVLVPYLLLSYWVKNLDQHNLNNAYVAGMKEELGFYGNELIQLQTIYIVGAVLGQIPFLFLFTYLPMYWVLPGMDVFWGIFTLLQFRANSYAEMMAYRFFVGWFEAPGIGGTKSVVVGASGYFIVPGTIAQPNPWVLNGKDLEIARRRLERVGHAVQGNLKLHHIKEIFLSKHFYIVLFVDILFWNGSTNSGAFLLWLKSLNRYDSAKVNQFGTLPSALGILYTLFANFSSDLLWGPAWGITLASGWNAVAMLILVIWDVPEAAKWFSFCSTSWSYALSSVLHGWVNNILRDSPGTRSFTLVFMNIMAQSSTAWTGILTYPTVEAPRYLKGFSFSLSCAIALIIGTHILNIYMKQKAKLKLNDLLEEQRSQHTHDHTEASSQTNKQAEVYTQARGEDGI
ncbi:MFS transporter (Seo1) [Parahypoxylon ruwenzoriense]